MLFEINSAYCSRCKSFVPVFDSINEGFSTTEINCSECGQILFVIRSEMQYQYDTDLSLENFEKYVKKENLKTKKKSTPLQIETNSA
ncbi:MAG: hypothetical protein HGN29_13000 [Asgard group archaeon]|nr:hypothetical protein [Asgard group archaeon]